MVGLPYTVSDGVPLYRALEFAHFLGAVTDDVTFAQEAFQFFKLNVLQLLYLPM